MIDMLEPPLHGVAIYNPRLLSKDELIRTFVARRAELERILDSLRREVDAQPQHHLVVGARGMGKTTLLNRLRYAIADDEKLGQRCLGLTFPEEQYNVGSLADFWLNCVDALADELEASGRKTLLAGLDDEVVRVQNMPTTVERRDRALELLCQLADRLERRLVLLVDNVDLVLDRLEDEQWTLRDVLSTEGRIQLVGATSAPLEAYYRHDKAFYDFFRVHHLQGLTEVETFEVLRELARATGQEHVADLLDAEPARIKTVRLMAGGNPRTVVILFSLLSQSTEGDVRADIERLLDSCTPLYKHRIEALSMQAQRVLDALAMRWFPSTAAEVAELMHLPVNVVSTQLDRLVKDGTIVKVELPDTKKHGFQIAERFFNIWFLMRASRRVRRRLMWLVDFLRMMFGQDELVRRARVHLLAPGDINAEHHAEMALALAEAIGEGHLRHALESQSLRLLCAEPALREHLGDVLDFEGVDANLTSRADRMRLLAETRDLLTGTTRKDIAALWERLGAEPSITAVAKHQVARAVLRAPQVAPALRAHFDRAHRLRQGSFLPRELEALYAAIRSGNIDVQQLDLDDLRATALVSGEALIPSALACVSGDLPRSQVDELFRTGLGSRSLAARIAWGRVAFRRGILPEQIVRELEAVLDEHPGDADAMCGVALLLEEVGLPERAEAVYRELLTKNPDHFIAVARLAALRYFAGDPEEASALTETALVLEPENFAMQVVQMALDTARGRVIPHEVRDSLVQRAISEPNAALMLGLAAIPALRWSQVSWTTKIFMSGDSAFLRGAWPQIAQFFSYVVSRGFIRQARRLLAQEGLAEQWEPLDRALDLLHRNDLAGLERLAPEMREAVRLTIAQIAPKALEDHAST